MIGLFFFHELKQVTDLALVVRAERVERRDIDPGGGLAVEADDSVPCEPGRSQHIRDFFLVLAHQAGQMYLDHDPLGVVKRSQDDDKHLEADEYRWVRCHLADDSHQLGDRNAHTT